MVKQYINGKMVEGQGKPMPVYNPATGEIIDTVGCATAEQAKEALLAAQAAQKKWANTALDERVAWLNKLREACLAEREKIVDLISAESGRPYPAACGDFDWCMTSLHYYGEEALRVYGTTFNHHAAPNGAVYHITERRPIGVVVAHLAWNYPLGNAGLKIAPSVASGCACVIKPSSQTPLATLYLGEICQRIGFPAGVINILSGPAGEVAKTLNESVIPRMIALIGSSETGLKILRESATSMKKYAFECGGNAPVVVMDDVDIPEVAASIVAKKVGFAGQTCVNYNRIYIHQSIYEEMIAAIARELDKVILGKGRDPGYVMGPMIDRKARDRMLSLIEDAVRRGAKLVKGGTVPPAFQAGSYITPALLRDVTDDMRVSTEDIFGPIIPVQPFTALEEAIEKANNTVYGLSAYFYGHRAPEIARAFEGFEAGEIFVNGAPGTEQTPHAGVKQSGMGVDKSPWSLDEFYDFKYLGLKP